MGGPWEKYQATDAPPVVAEGPWTKYQLPPGFVMDAPQKTAGKHELPPGFVLDAPPDAKASSGPASAKDKPGLFDDLIPNPFDKFDPPASREPNPFNQFDARPAVAKSRPGLFDDIPVDPAFAAAQARRPGLFDDLIPEKPATAGAIEVPAVDAMGNATGPAMVVPKAPDTRYRDDIATITKSQDGTAAMLRDVMKSFGSGAVRGVTGAVGLPSLASKGLDWLADSGAEWYTGKPVPSAIQRRPVTEFLSTDAINRNIDSVTGKPITSYVPQTIAGEYARTTGEFLPGLAVPGGPAARIIKGVVMPALATESAGQAARSVDPGLEGPVRAVTAVASGLGAAALSRPGTAHQAISRSMSGIDDATVVAAGELMRDAAVRGLNLTMPEALNQVSSGAAGRMGNLQRLVEGSQEGSSVMAPFMAQRPAQVEQAGRAAFSEIAPQSTAPSALGPTLGQAAEGKINDVRRAINDVSTPFYKAAAPTRITPEEFARIQALPGYPDAAKAIRSDPQLARYVEGLSEDTVGFQNEIKKFLGTSAENASSPVNAQKNMQRSAGFASDENVVKDAATAASPEYAKALEIQARARDEILQPLLNGPLGKIASKDTTTQQAISTLFPASPLPGSAAEIATAVGALAKSKPKVAAQLVRAHAESVFNEATQTTIAGGNSFGGAKFVSQLRGNPQQAENLTASIKAVAGPDVAQGFDRFLDVLAATGQRQRQGSPTAFNQEMQETLKGGSKLGEAASLLAGGLMQAPRKVRDAYQGWQLGKNTSQIAGLITDPTAVGVFRELAAAAPGSRKADALVKRLAIIGTYAKTAYQPREHRAD